jgi:hypothetical protein
MERGGHAAADDRSSEGSGFGHRFELLLHDAIRPFLRAHGFTRSGPTFRRNRVMLRDRIGFQQDRLDDVAQWHAFRVDVAVGSTETVYVVQRPWQDVVPGLPAEVRFDDATDMVALADCLCDGLLRVITVLDEFDSTAGLLQYAADQGLRDEG